jgi:CheY-like chemotaxis protein
MSLNSLVVCSDDKIIRVLRRVLADLEIGMETCSDGDSAIRKLTRQRYEAVIVDCADEDMASQILKSTRNAPCNKRAIAVALIDGQSAVRSAFGLGAHFVLYKPISTERAKTSFRAARALMKRERRRNSRVPVQIPVTLSLDNGAGQQQTTSSDLGEGGMAVQLVRRPKNAGSMRVQFTLPGTKILMNSLAEFAWENNEGLAGLRFMDLSPENSTRLKNWLVSQSPESERDDPPVPCKLTDLSLGGCYLEIASPFPVQTRVLLTMQIAQLHVQAQGAVRVMHPEIGMGVEFTQKTREQKEAVDKFIQALMNNSGPGPQLLVEPDGLETDTAAPIQETSGEDVDDPLIELFQNKSNLPVEAFLSQLRSQRNAPEAATP